ncbi:MAG: hypothetical protein PHO12_03695 [Bacteroidales bacterium]|nr:hypothetical protein [Bacteroidales bacterium]MDD4683706.1 hypothetical protein [Bacteroidales bacterium]
MKNKIIILLSVLFAFISLSFVSCQDDKSLASEDWNGNWQLNESVNFPQAKNNENPRKSNSGTIQIDPNDNRQIIINGDLFGLYSSLKIKAKVVSTTASFEETIGKDKMKGTGVLVNKDKINFSFTITTENNQVESYKRTATRIK